MILVTVGTQKQSFRRLFDYINEMNLKEDIVVQKGNIKYRFRQDIMVYDYLSFEEMDYYMKKARVIVTHGGGGTIFKALQLNKKVIVVPRLKKYGEHINNHQIEIANFLSNRKLCLVAYDKKGLEKMITEIDNFIFKKYFSMELDFIHKIGNEINLLLENNEKDY